MLRQPGIRSLILTVTYMDFSHILAGYLEAHRPYAQADFTAPFWFRRS